MSQHYIDEQVCFVNMEQGSSGMPKTNWSYPGMYTGSDVLPSTHGVLQRELPRLPCVTISLRHSQKTHRKSGRHRDGIAGLPCICCVRGADPHAMRHHCRWTFRPWQEPRMHSKVARIIHILLKSLTLGPHMCASMIKALRRAGGALTRLL
ncbi:hypothetical protein BC628DRAFT_480533 [Trametes gibbosa]|nr:hypothetical protein BC628DRAFT_480533 [Trametes gibbosa]